MSYQLEGVKRFTQGIADQIQQHKKDVTYLTGTRWKEKKDKVTSKFEALKFDFSNKTALYQYIAAINLAAVHLIDKRELGTKVTESRQLFIDEHVGKLKRIIDEHHPELQYEMPSKKSKIKNSSEEVIGGAMGLKEAQLLRNARDKAARKNFIGKVRKFSKFVINQVEDEIEPRTNGAETFLNSQEFKNLKDYQQFLTYDQRSHTYFCGRLDMSSYESKAAVLKTLIEKLEEAKDMDTIKGILDSYKKGKIDGYYETLNKGQNITTRLLALKTTSVKHLEAVIDLAESTKDHLLMYQEY